MSNTGGKERQKQLFAGIDSLEKELADVSVDSDEDFDDPEIKAYLNNNDKYKDDEALIKSFTKDKPKMPEMIQYREPVQKEYKAPKEAISRGPAPNKPAPKANSPQKNVLSSISSQNFEAIKKYNTDFHSYNSYIIPSVFAAEQEILNHIDPYLCLKNPEMSKYFAERKEGVVKSISKFATEPKVDEAKYLMLIKKVYGANLDLLKSPKLDEVNKKRVEERIKVIKLEIDNLSKAFLKFKNFKNIPAFSQKNPMDLSLFEPQGGDAKPEFASKYGPGITVDDLYDEYKGVSPEKKIIVLSERIHEYKSVAKFIHENYAKEREKDLIDRIFPLVKAAMTMIEKIKDGENPNITNLLTKEMKKVSPDILLGYSEHDRERKIIDALVAIQNMQKNELLKNNHPAMTRIESDIDYLKNIKPDPWIAPPLLKKETISQENYEANEDIGPGEVLVSFPKLITNDNDIKIDYSIIIDDFNDSAASEWSKNGVLNLSKKHQVTKRKLAKSFLRGHIHVNTTKKGVFSNTKFPPVEISLKGLEKSATYSGVIEVGKGYKLAFTVKIQEPFVKEVVKIEFPVISAKFKKFSMPPFDSSAVDVTVKEKPQSVIEVRPAKISAPQDKPPAPSPEKKTTTSKNSQSINPAPQTEPNPQNKVAEVKKEESIDIDKLDKMVFKYTIVGSTAKNNVKAAIENNFQEKYSNHGLELVKIIDYEIPDNSNPSFLDELHKELELQIGRASSQGNSDLKKTLRDSYQKSLKMHTVKTKNMNEGELTPQDLLESDKKLQEEDKIRIAIFKEVGFKEGIAFLESRMVSLEAEIKELKEMCSSQTKSKIN